MNTKDRSSGMRAKWVSVGISGGADADKNDLGRPSRPEGDHGGY